MLFSIITINYNNCEGLRRTIESVIGQTFNDFEFLVIDGCSTDGSVDIIKEYAASISYWVSERDNGIYHAMNKGITQAHGDYCIFMNSGDCFYNNNVLRIIESVNSNDDIIIGKVSVNKPGVVISPPPKGELTFYHLYSGSIPHQGSFIRTELLRKKPYDENLRISSDWKFFVQTIIIDNCSVRFVDEYVAKYDLNGFSSDNPKLMREEKERVLKELFPPRVLEDYRMMKASECLTQTLTPQLRNNFGIDKVLYRIGNFLLKLRRNKKNGENNPGNNLDANIQGRTVS